MLAPVPANCRRVAFFQKMNKRAKTPKKIGIPLFWHQLPTRMLKRVSAYNAVLKNGNSATEGRASSELTGKMPSWKSLVGMCVWELCMHPS